MQEVVNQLTNAEKEAVSIRTGALDTAKIAQQDAEALVKDKLSQAKTEATEKAKEAIVAAQSEADTIIADGKVSAAKQREELRVASKENLEKAALFVMERIVDKV